MNYILPGNNNIAVLNILTVIITFFYNAFAKKLKKAGKIAQCHYNGPDYEIYTDRQSNKLRCW